MHVYARARFVYWRLVLLGRKLLFTMVVTLMKSHVEAQVQLFAASGCKRLQACACGVLSCGLVLAVVTGWSRGIAALLCGLNNNVSAIDCVCMLSRLRCASP